ncbi:MAG: isoleucine--tRNA ligase [Candidatus Gracilibacteria bacterium]|nr:isoleucine--tRNA ligase [Candidatus Gracilibacteria bacterium]
MKNFKEVNPRQSFPKLEEEILSFWKENKIFEKSIENRADAPEFNFYDGPPFATGTPHYGHILAGTIKDVIPRYQTMNGFRVDRKFGWDCHGLPIENIVEKKMNISGKDDIEKRVGVYEFNEACRSNVFGYVEDWKKTVDRMGRWVDMENSYKTMDSDFMESVWWVYKSLYEKGLIYEGHRVVPYCPRCSTPLSNFEVNQGYKDKQDKTVTVKFKVTGSANKYILVWTTTPWTLVSNLGIAVGVDLDYVELLDKKTSETYVLAKDRIGAYYKNEEDYTIVREYKGACLVGIKYEPIFDDFFILNEANSMPLGMELGKNVWSIVPGHHVTTDSGTGIVHMAPAYGEDDNLIGKEQSLGFVAHIADNGNTENLLTDNGIPVFEYNELAITKLKEKNVIFLLNTFDHSYPHCWRCDTPLIYRAISAWYVAVEKIRDKMVENNQEINWTPEIIKNGRFGKWVEAARDWNISRNRYWGSAIPVWQNEDKSCEVCIGSIAEMYELNKDFGQIEKVGEKYFYTNTNKEVDIHKHFVDDIKLKDPKTGETLKRVPEVLDCWFESGAMPYASKHYPFEKDSKYKFPGDFIAEGLDQTRGWFYTLLILGTALFEKAPMKNVIVNGIVLAEDGQKMSKSKKNYPDPQIIFDNYGADAMRFYLMNSPVVEAQDLRFAEAGVEEVVKKVILPLWNTYSFFTTYANIDNFKSSFSLGGKDAGKADRGNNLDKWLISELNELTKEVGEGFDGYKLNEAAKPIVKFMDNLTNWYIRRSRKRFWKSENDNDKLEAYETLYFTLVETCKIIAPFMPFVSEYIYKNLTSETSVHLTDFPKYDSSLINLELNKDTDLVQKVITLGLAWRANQKIRVRQPLKSITITFEISDYYKEIIKEELNVKEVLVVEGTTLARKICKPNGRTIGPKFGSNVKAIMEMAKSGNFEELENASVKVGDFILEAGDFELVYESGSSLNAIEAGFGMVISMDSNITPELKNEGYIRDIVRHIQESRKEADYKVDDRIQVSISGCDEVIKNFKEYIQNETLSTIVDSLETFEINKDLEIEDLRINLRLKK